MFSSIWKALSGGIGSRNFRGSIDMSDTTNEDVACPTGSSMTFRSMRGSTTWRRASVRSDLNGSYWWACPGAAPSAIAYRVRHPGPVRPLVLYGTYAVGWAQGRPDGARLD